IRYQSEDLPVELDAAIDGLTEVWRLLDGQPRHPLAAHVKVQLSLASRLRADRGDAPGVAADAGSAEDDRRRAVEQGLAALRPYGNDVLLQTGAADGLVAARGAAGHARQVAEWCLADGRPEQALEALELGRGLVLHAATVATAVPELLQAAGYAALAQEWE